MKLILTTKSHLLAGSGEGQALVDADAIFDKNGFPFIPGKRIKGLLRESALEVMEMIGKSYDQLIDQVFGKRGQSAQVNFENFYLTDYAEILSNLNKLDTYLFKLINTETIKKRYSVEIQQTAVNDLGVAAAFSLRNYRVLKKELIFEATLSGSIPKSHQALLYLAVINLKHIGTRRNRGFGLIDLHFDGLDLDLTDALNALSVTKVNESTDVETTLSYTKEKGTVTHQLQYTIKTGTPLVISKQRGDQNTVYSDSYIPASTVTGMLAEQIIAKKNSSDQPAHDDDFFFDLILDADKKITDAFPTVLNDIFYPAPMALQKRKGSSDKTLYNIFAKRPEDVTKPAQGWFKIGENGYEETEIEKTFYFHNTRMQNRAEGRSLDGGIFYYDSIDKGQCFSGWIYGSSSLLEHLIQLCGTEFETRIGRSRTSQYGLVQVNFKAIEPIKPDTFDDHALLMFTSPAIFYNDSGFPEASLKLLSDYLTKHFLGCATVSINKLIAATETVENYLNVWKSKTPAEAAFSKGTCFEITIADVKHKAALIEQKNLLLHRGLGERTDEGFGHVVVLTGNAEVNKIAADNRPPDNAENTPIHEEIKHLLKIIYDQKNQQQIKMMVMELAENKPVNGQFKINNSLVGRLEAMLNEAKDFSKWKNNYLGHIENQRSGKRLKEIGLWDKLNNEKIPSHHETDALRDKLSAYGIETETDAFADFTSYWKTFFRTIRKLNKVYEPNCDRSAISQN